MTSLESAQAAYIAYLEESLKQVGGYLYVHNWNWGTEFLAEGDRLREAIKQSQGNEP